MKILFVCLGNICRSPMAEAVMRDCIQKNPQTSFTVDSCGTSSWHRGEAPHPKTLEQLSIHNIDSSNLYARPLSITDFETFDVIIAMDKQNLNDLRNHAPMKHHHKIYLFLDILDDKQGQDLPDPWYTGAFDETYHLVRRGVDKWFEYLNQL